MLNSHEQCIAAGDNESLSVRSHQVGQHIVPARRTLHGSTNQQLKDSPYLHLLHLASLGSCQCYQRVSTLVYTREPTAWRCRPARSASSRQIQHCNGILSKLQSLLLFPFLSERVLCPLLEPPTASSFLCIHDVFHQRSYH